MNNAITTALEAYAPVIAASYTRIIERAFADYVRRFGLSLNGVYNSEGARFFSESVRPCIVNTNKTRSYANDSYVIDSEKLASRAASYAAATVKEFEAKIAAKMGELEGAEVTYLDGSRFQIRGTKGNKAVLIEQDMIVNQSSRGKVFNQFPARIYVEGKFMSEAKFKKAFSA